MTKLLEKFKKDALKLALWKVRNTGAISKQKFIRHALFATDSSHSEAFAWFVLGKGAYLDNFLFGLSTKNYLTNVCQM